ncbi:MAG: hypothetical protein ACPID7_06655, partial [Candidatus Puniceispirillum sp.]
PLQREWYPFLMGLKHDILMQNGALPALRIAKTQTPALSSHILASHILSSQNGADADDES